MSVLNLCAFVGTIVTTHGNRTVVIGVALSSEKKMNDLVTDDPSDCGGHLFACDCLAVYHHEEAFFEKVMDEINHRPPEHYSLDVQQWLEDNDDYGS